MVGIAIASIVPCRDMGRPASGSSNRLQDSSNLVLGSALAGIGLTIPAVVGVSIFLGLPLVLGLNAKEMTLLALTFLVGISRWTPAARTCCRALATLVLGAAVVLSGCGRNEPREDWVIRSQVVFLSPDLLKERKAPPVGKLRLWFPYVSGDLYGPPSTGSFYDVTVKPDYSFEIDLNKAHGSVLKSLQRTAFSMSSLAIAPTDARFARLLPHVLEADGIEPLGQVDWIDADTKRRLMLVYMDRKARIAGSQQNSDRTLIYDVWTNEPDYIWVSQSDNKTTSEWSRAKPKRVLLAVTPRAK